MVPAIRFKSVYYIKNKIIINFFTNNLFLSSTFCNSRMINDFVGWNVLVCALMVRNNARII